MKKNLRFYIALFAAKLAAFGMKLLGKRASYLPGLIAIKLCPDFMGRIDKPAKIIAVTGTNGKTTCCNLILNTLQELGYDVLNNKYGSNVAAGVASSLLSGATLGGKAKYDLAVFEIDERSSVRIYPYLTPTYLVCTNLFRDSIRRNAHSEYISGIITDYLPKETTLILNADDNVSSRLAPENKRKYFGILPMAGEDGACENIVNDMRLCPMCHRKLEYSLIRYHHIGRASCPSCGFASPAPDYAADVDLSAMRMILSMQGKKYAMPLLNDSVFNAYNQTAVSALLSEFGLEPEKFIPALCKQKIVESRFSDETIGNIEVITNMCKGQNPIACSCVFGYVKKSAGTKEVVLLLEDDYDNEVSSENMTWLYDADFEFLNIDSVKRIIVGGVRSLDFKVRMLIAGIPEEKIVCVPTFADTPDALGMDCDKIYILHDLHANDIALRLRDKVKNTLHQNEEAKA